MMYQIAFALLACLADTGFAEVVRTDSSGFNKKFESLSPFARLLLTSNPAAGWQPQLQPLHALAQPAGLRSSVVRSSAVKESVQPNTQDAQSSTVQDAHWMDALKFKGSTPEFDVLERTKEYSSKKTYEEVNAYYADDYVFRGSIIGPITSKDTMDTQKGFNIQNAYPDLDRGLFGYTIDPQNPFRCFFFERWTGTHTGEVDIGFAKIPATGNRVETPLHITSIWWNPEGKIIYQSISPPLDRFEGNTKGAGAVFGLLTGTGTESPFPPSVGHPFLILQQKFVQSLGIVGKQWSDEEDIPDWWKSKARGADANDM